MQSRIFHDFSAAMNEMENLHLRSKSQPTIMKKCMLLQVYDRHRRSWSRYSGFVCHLPTSFANHRWIFADSGLLGSMASPFTVLFLFPLQTSPVLFPLLRLLVEACPVLRHSGAVQAFSLPYVFEVSSGRVMKISII